MARARKKKAPPRAEVIEPEIIDAEIVGESPTQALAVREQHVDLALPNDRTLLTAFLADKHAKSAKKYRGDLADFTAWMQTGESDPKKADRPSEEEIQDMMDRLVHVRDRGQANNVLLGFRTHLLQRELAPNTINRKLAAIRSFVKMARVLGICHWELEIPGVETELVRDVEGCGEEGYAALVNAAESEVQNGRDMLEDAKGDKAKRKAHRALTIALRNFALLRLYHDAGLRRIEPLDVVFPDEIDLRSKARIKFRGKKRKARKWHAINRRCADAIKAWVQVRGDDPGPLFIGTHPAHYGKPLNERTVNKIIAKLGKLAEVQITPHGLRHTAATTLLDKTDGNVRAVAEFLRHKDTSIVQVYDDKRKQLARKMGNLFDDEEDS